MVAPSGFRGSSGSVGASGNRPGGRIRQRHSGKCDCAGVVAVINVDDADAGALGEDGRDGVAHLLGSESGPATTATGKGDRAVGPVSQLHGDREIRPNHSSSLDECTRQSRDRQASRQEGNVSGQDQCRYASSRDSHLNNLHNQSIAYRGGQGVVAPHDNVSST